VVQHQYQGIDNAALNLMNRSTGESMTGKLIAATLLAATVLSPLAGAQELQVGSNAYVDMYFADWHASKAQTMGPVTEYTVFTKGDAMKPASKGAILRYVDSYVFATLAPGASSPSVTLSGKQRIYYFTSGAGAISAGGESVPISVNIAVLVPASLAFTIKNTGKNALGAYVITEPTPSGFQPGTKLVAKDETSTPVSTAQEEWSRIVRPLFTSVDGLATISSVETVTLDSMTITRPFIGTMPNTEQLWMQLSGTTITFIGPYLRRQTAGMAYEHPPDNLAPTANVNYSEDSQVKFLLVATDGN
jgi:mannose-6-phosphate isomerase-like protein (cupin superfamily)